MSKKSTMYYRQRLPIMTGLSNMKPGLCFAVRLGKSSNYKKTEEAAVRDLLKVCGCEVIMLVGYSNE